MDNGPDLQWDLRRAGVVFLFALIAWTVVGAVSVTQYLSQVIARGTTFDWAAGFLAPMSSVWLWALMTPAMFLLSDRFRFTRATWLRALSIHAGWAVAFSVVDVAIDTWILLPLIGLRTGSFLLSQVAELFLNVYSYGAVVALAHAVRYAQMYRQQQLESARLESDLVRARVETLRAHLQPHFLFNAINAVTELIHSDPDRADRVMTLLSRLLRRAFSESDHQVVTLQEEMDFVHKYLEIAEVRFGDRLGVEVDVTSEAEAARVPGFLLQPLVENAIHHAVEKVSGPVRIHIRASVSGERLNIRVEDSGPGFSGTTGTPDSGTGLSRIEDLLDQMYGSGQSFTIGHSPLGGGLVEIDLPLTPSATLP
jgi:signal transduction histidine kinase